VNGIEQGTQEWLNERAGHVTASRINDVLTKPRKGQKESAVRKAYMAQLICERLTGKSLEEDKGSYWDIKRGKELESTVRSEYDLRTGSAVETAGFVKHPKLAWAGCSPDGYVGEIGLVQLKAPRRHVHLDWLINRVVPAEHKNQMLFELACLPERQWNDFVSYVDDLPSHLQTFIARQTRDAVKIAEIETAVAEFNAEIEEKICKLNHSGDADLTPMLEQSLKEVADKPKPDLRFELREFERAGSDLGGGRKF
jgi:hypothetical protein